ncbi:uncharacterized protein LOC134243664, partial [Saccostrea cucullata]|uniref:uncharacterized protein LOC134243664 n=1 Tax=Saccostrea cuccullata TaxID=36930 RepID=UPI002ED4E35D
NTDGRSFSSKPITDSQETTEKDARTHNYIVGLLNRDVDNDSDEPETSEEDFPISLDLRDFEDPFPFENLVFEGGGAKGVAYPGAIQALEELGLIKQIKRFAGTSVGSMTACMVALGYNSTKIKEVLEKDFRTFYDARLGRLSLIPNMLFHLGWQPMNTLFEFFGDLVAEKLARIKMLPLKMSVLNILMKSPDLYTKTGKELCIVVMNVNNMEEEYFHLKTTPNVPLRMAMRMSASLPVFFKNQDFNYDFQYSDNEQQSFRDVYESREKRRIVYPERDKNGQTSYTKNEKRNEAEKRTCACKRRH